MRFIDGGKKLKLVCIRVWYFTTRNIPLNAEVTWAWLPYWTHILIFSTSFLGLSGSFYVGLHVESTREKRVGAPLTQLRGKGPWHAVLTGHRHWVLPTCVRLQRARRMRNVFIYLVCHQKHNEGLSTQDWRKATTIPRNSDKLTIGVFLGAFGTATFT